MRTDSPVRSWFRANQPLLLALAATAYGRDLLGIPQDSPRIVRVLPDGMTSYVGREGGRDVFRSEFRTHAKWAKVIRHRADPFQVYARYFLGRATLPISPGVMLARSARATVTTVFSDLGGDGFTEGASASYATAGNTGGTAFGSAADIQFGQQYHSPSGRHFRWRVFLPFDTSSIPDSDTLNDATVSLYGTNKLDSAAVTPSAQIVASSQASSTALATADHTTLGATSYASMAYGSWSAAGYNAFTLNAGGLALVSKTGFTNLGARTNRDISGSAPSTGGNFAETFYCYGADQTGTSNDPKLVVTHTATATASPLLTLLGVS